MKKMILVPLLLLTSVAFAQTMTSLQMDKASVQTGQAVQATIGLDGDLTNCGMRIEWGDGTSNDLKVEKPEQKPFKTSHTYAKAGDYTVKVVGAKVTSHFRCIGKDMTAAVKVNAPAPVAAAPAPAQAPAAAPTPAAAPVAAAPMTKATAAPAAANSRCPAGWKLSAQSVNKKTKAFTCMAKPGTAIPDASLECPGELSYFENSKKGMLGCRP